MGEKEKGKEKEKEVEKKEKEKEKVVEKKVVDEVITATYKVNLHCPECANEIKMPLLRSQGIHGVDANIEKNEIKVKGVIDPLKIQKRMERLSGKRVELISPKVDIKKTVEKEKPVVKEAKEPPVRTTSIRVHMHCDQCERDLRRKLLRHKGIYNVKTDMKAQTLTVNGTIEPEKLLSYVRSKVHKRAEIIPPKPAEKKDEKKEKVVVEKEKEKTKVVEGGGKTEETTEPMEEKKVVEVKTKEGNPYFIHYAYAPQLFSDENPHACSIM